jgi:hypothetical protein
MNLNSDGPIGLFESRACCPSDRRTYLRFWVRDALTLRGLPRRFVVSKPETKPGFSSTIPSPETLTYSSRDVSVGHLLRKVPRAAERLIDRSLAGAMRLISLFLTVDTVGSEGHGLQALHRNFLAAAIARSVAALLQQIECEIYCAEAFLGPLYKARVRLYIR